MSYILEALRKVERQRRVRAVPDLATVHGPSPARRVWVPVVLGVLLVNAGLLALLLWYRPWAPSALPPVPLAKAPAADVAGPPPAASDASALATPPGVGPPASSPAVAPAPPVVASAPSPAVTPAPSPGAAASGPGPTAGAPAPDVPAHMVPPAPAAPRVRVTVPASPGDAAVARDAATPEQSGTPERPAVAEPSPRDPAPTTGATPPPARPAPRAAVKATVPAGLPAPFRDAVSRLRLEALVYADSPKDRKVFINGRRYVEGDKLDDGIVVERIVEEGAVLSYLGHRYVLRHFR